MMMRSTNYCLDTKDTLELEPIKESREEPPTWEEVMKEKTLETNGTNKTNTISEITRDFITEETKTNGVKRKEQPLDEPDHVEVLTPIERLIAMLNKILNILKAISQWSATVSDTLLWLFSLGSFVVGCLILTGHFEVTKVVYRHEFRSLGKTLVVLSSLNLIIVCPFGVFGIWKKKRGLLKWHNIMLLLMIIVQLIVLYMCFKYLHKTKKSQEKDFREQFNSLYVKCRVDNKNIGTGDCCCVDRNTYNREICWEYEPYPGISKDDPYIGYNDRCRSEKMDYFDRLIAVIQRGHFYLLIALAVEISALGFGMLQIQLLSSDECDSKKRKKRPKGKLRKIYRKARNMICKRFLMVMFTVVFVLSLVLLRLWYKGFVIKIRGMQVNLLELLSSQFNERILTSEESVDVSKLL